VYHGVYALIGCLSIVSSHAIISMNRPSRPHGVSCRPMKRYGQSPQTMPQAERKVRNTCAIRCSH